MAMHLSLLTNFLFRHFDLPLRPPLHRLPPQMPHLLEDPLFGRVRLLEISLRVLYGADYRRESISKIRVLLEKCQKLLVAPAVLKVAIGALFKGRPGFSRVLAG